MFFPSTPLAPTDPPRTQLEGTIHGQAKGRTTWTKKIDVVVAFLVSLGRERGRSRLVPFFSFTFCFLYLYLSLTHLFLGPPYTQLLFVSDPLLLFLAFERVLARESTERTTSDPSHHSSSRQKLQPQRLLHQEEQHSPSCASELSGSLTVDDLEESRKQGAGISDASSEGEKSEKRTNVSLPEVVSKHR